MTQHLSLAVSRSDAGAATSPVLMIHSFLSSGAVDWPPDRWANPLAQRGHSVIAPDLPAHGASGAVDGADAVSLAALVDALAALLDRPADVVGYSLGARIAWALAARYPDRVRRLVLGGLSPMDPFAVLDYPAARAFAATGEQPSDPMTAMIAGAVVGAGGDVASRLNFMQGLSRDPFDPAGEAPSCPTLFVLGDDDQIAAGIEDLAKARGDRLVRVPGDHFAALHTPEFREAVLAHLD